MQAQHALSSQPQEAQPSSVPCCEPHDECNYYYFYIIADLTCVRMTVMERESSLKTQEVQGAPSKGPQHDKCKL